MPKTNLNSDTADDQRVEPSELTGHLDRDAAVRQGITETIRRCNKSRGQIAEEMSALVGRFISVRHLDDWSASSKQQFRFPASYLLAFCFVTGDSSLVRLLLPPREKALVEIAEQFLAKARAERRVAMLNDVLSQGGSR